VRAVGEYTWRQTDAKHRFDALVVVSDDGFGRRTRFEVPSPRELGRQIKELADDELPRFTRGSVKRGAKTEKAAGAAPVPAAPEPQPAKPK
jgi:hypothetical protein